MKKVLSVAMASAMVLGMGANAFAIEYNTDSKDTAKWPEDFKFAGSLFVTDKNGNLKKDSTTAIKSDRNADFAPGDVIWMPLYADGQLKYTAAGTTADTEAKDAVNDLKLNTVTMTAHQVYKYSDGKYYYKNASDGVGEYTVTTEELVATGEKHTHPDGTVCDVYNVIRVAPAYTTSLAGTGYEGREVENVKYYIGATRYATEADFFTALKKQGNVNNAYVTVDVKAVNAADGEAGNPTTDGKLYNDSVYTGNIDKDWSINLKDSTNAVEEIVKKAELYRATAKDAKKYGTAINGVYVKVTLKDEWKHITEETIKYYVYIAENKTEETTNEVWVSGTYANDNVKIVNFKWTNNANTPAVWKAEENGEAVFDYNDKAFFTVKMYEGEKLYLDLKTAYDRITSNAIYDLSGAEVDSFYNFVTADANFSREGELVLVTDNEELVPYQINEDGEVKEVENYEYVKGYAIAHTKEKVNGFKFNTKELGNYILSEEIVAEEEVEEPETEEPATETPAPEAPVVEEKPNPNTGAEDFVGLAVSLAVVSVAAAGALALKK